MRITSTRVETRGGHDHVTLWADGQNIGTLRVDEGRGRELLEQLGRVEGLDRLAYLLEAGPGDTDSETVDRAHRYIERLRSALSRARAISPSEIPVPQP